MRNETDSLVAGAGASGLAFPDTLVDEADVEVTAVDRRGAPGVTGSTRMMPPEPAPPVRGSVSRWPVGTRSAPAFATA